MNRFCLYLCLSALVLSGCVAVSAAGKPVKKTSQPKIGLAGPEGGTATLPDPKLPGKYLWKMSFRGLHGMSGDAGQFSGTLTGVTATLYQHGVASALMTAPVANGNSVSQTIVATGPGRISVKSLVEHGTTLDADKMTCYLRTNKIVAEGHVVYHNGKNGLILHVARMDADTVLKHYASGAGSGDLP